MLLSLRAAKVNREDDNKYSADQRNSILPIEGLTSPLGSADLGAGFSVSARRVPEMGVIRTLWNNVAPGGTICSMRFCATSGARMLAIPSYIINLGRRVFPHA